MHKLLLRQLKRNNSSYDSLASIPEEWKPTLDAISTAYEQFDEDRLLLERAMDLASQELLERNQRLTQDISERQRSEAAIQESEGRFRQLAENIQDVFWMFDVLNSEILYISPAYEEIWGRSCESIYKKEGSYLDAVLPEDRELALACFQKQLAGEITDCEFRITRPDGSLRWIWTRAFPIQNEAGQVYRITAVSKDITERKRAEEALRQANRGLELRVAERTLELKDANEQLQSELNERRLAQEALRVSEERHRTLLRSLPQRVFFKDRESTFILVNTAFANDLGMSPQDVVGKTDYDIHSKELAEKYRADDRRVMATRQIEVLQEVNVISDPDGQGEVERTVEVVKAPVMGSDGEVLGVLGLFTDITERRSAQEALERAMAEAEKANRAKSEFLSRMSHELRTPLNSILGFAQLLRMDSTTPEQHESVDYIMRGGKHLLELINEVLDIARIETGKLSLSPEPVSLAEILQQCLDLVRPMAAQHKLHLQMDELLRHDWHVLADPQRFTQVLLNLLANAIKYNRAGGSVCIACEQLTGNRMRIQVSDTGPGIPSGKMSQLFVPFERLGAEQSTVEGTGLGLALSKHLMEAMGGSIGVDSEAGKGSTFWVELPLIEGQVQQLERLRTGPLTLDGMPVQERKILYIEDNLSNLRLIERILGQRPDIKLVSAMQGGLGIDLARQHHPDLILLDLNLPDIPGEEVLRRLRDNPETNAIPVVVISADATPRQIEQLLTAGARAYLTKPLDLLRFAQVLEETL